jgi:hypothetical protein
MSDNNRQDDIRRKEALEREKNEKNKADTDKDASSKRMGGTGSLTQPNNIRSTFNDIINDIITRLTNKIITDKDVYFNINDIQCTLTNINLSYFNWKLSCQNAGYILINLTLDVPINERNIEIDITNFNNNKLFVNYFDIDIQTIKTIELKQTSALSTISSTMNNMPPSNKSSIQIPIKNFTDILSIKMEYNTMIPSYKQIDLSIKKPNYVDIGIFYGYNNLYIPPKKELQEEENKIFLKYLINNIDNFNKIKFTKTELGLIDISNLNFQPQKSTINSIYAEQEVAEEIVIPKSLVLENFGNISEYYNSNNNVENNTSYKFIITIIILLLLIGLIYYKFC